MSLPAAAFGPVVGPVQAALTSVAVCTAAFAPVTAAGQPPAPDAVAVLEVVDDPLEQPVRTLAAAAPIAIVRRTFGCNIAMSGLLGDGGGGGGFGTGLVGAVGGGSGCRSGCRAAGADDDPGALPGGGGETGQS